MNTTAKPHLDAFRKFAKTSDNPLVIKDLKHAVVYTRVSSKEQQDKTLSLDFQKKVILDYAHRNDFKIAEYFGSRYESAKTDGRGEFNRMLSYLKSAQAGHKCRIKGKVGTGYWVLGPSDGV